MDDDLFAGDVLSYSAGTTQKGPDGYRVIRRAGASLGPDMLAAVAGRWPDLLELLGDVPPLILNGYPAATGDFTFGIQIDSYLSIPVGLRALRLARRDDRCAIILAQPLWLAELVHQAAEQDDDVFPGRVIAATGGYPLPASLERFLAGRCAANGAEFGIVQLFGIAEVDAGCLVGRDRDATARTIFHPRDDVRIGGFEGELSLSRRHLDGAWSASVSSGDRFEWAGGGPDDGIVILDGTRVLDGPREVLESWDDEGWARRTGYLRRGPRGILAQTRMSQRSPGGAHQGTVGGGWAEEEHHEFARQTGASYLTKPEWRCS